MSIGNVIGWVILAFFTVGLFCWVAVDEGFLRTLCALAFAVAGATIVTLATYLISH